MEMEKDGSFYLKFFKNISCVWGAISTAIEDFNLDVLLFSSLSSSVVVVHPSS